ncbi:MAG: flagellar hook-length control protein FliK, partial [Synergistales bacterium]|nr:flagellar hook-length control protein FliK [Synergistales bacterium]
PIELQSDYPLGDTGPIELQSEFPLGDTGPIELQAVKLPPESGLAVESTGIGTSPKDNILSPLPAGLSGISLDGLEVNGPDGVDAEMEIPVSSTVEPKPLSQQINEGGKTENGDPLSTMSLNGQKEEYPATEGFSAKRTDIQNVSEDVLSARENSYVASSPLVVEEAISRLKGSSPRTFESRGYSLKMESTSTPEDSLEAKTDATVVDKEPIRPQTPTKEAPVFLSSWNPEKREGKFQPVAEISENKPEDSAQRATDQGFENLIVQGEARQSVQPRSEVVPAQTIYLPQKGPDALPHGLAQVVRQVMADGTQKATVIIDPPALGRVEVEVRATSTGIEASFKVDSAQVRDMIKPQIPILQDMLSQNGIVASSISVDIRQGDERRSPWRDSLDSIKLRRRKGAVDEGEVEITSMEIARIDMERGVLQWYA